MKVMIVSTGVSLRRATTRVLAILTGVEVVEANHDDALEKLLSEEPDRVLIWEYEETGSSRDEYNRGRSTYRDIKNSAPENVIVIRCGLSKYDYPDYIKAPFELQDLFMILELKTIKTK